jgi:hypothetical protein
MSFGEVSMKRLLLGFIIMLTCSTGCLNNRNSKDSTAEYDLLSIQAQETTFDDELGGMGIYFGNFHSHSTISGAQGTPDEVLTWAKTSAGFDFYVMTDHAEEISSSEWKQMLEETDKFNEDGVFVAMRGFEWSSSVFGHVCVYNTDRYTNSIVSPFLLMFYCWLNFNDGLAQFNHPGREELMFRNFMYIKCMADNFFAVETGNKDTGNNDHTYLNYYTDALDKGWRVAPTSNQDNHSMKTNSHRSVAIMDSLTRQGLIDAMKARRIYSSDDPNMEIIFKQNEAWMGSVIKTSDDIVKFKIWIRDDEPIKKVTVYTNNGAAAAEFIPDYEIYEVKWEPEIEISNSTYFYVQVEEENLFDEDIETQIAVTAPIWVTRN